LVSGWTTLHFVGWVAPSEGFVGFRSTQPNLHIPDVITEFETQQQPITDPNLKSFFSDRPGRIFLARSRAYVKIRLIGQQNAEHRGSLFQIVVLCKA
jgi:hypothetical protein